MSVGALEAFGARLEISAPDAGVLDEIAASLPGARRAETTAAPDERLAITRSGPGLVVGGEPGERFATRAAAVAAAVSRLHFAVARHARDAVFLHAGAVAFEGRLILLPGRTFAGKSTLTMALVEAGGEYYSDEYAPIDPEGRVLPYRKRPSLRQASPLSPAAMPAGDEPPARRCDLVLGCRFDAEARWTPEPLSAGQGALLLVSNAVVAQPRPEATARAAAAVVRHARCYHTPRPTARLAVEGIRRLLADLDAQAAAGAGAPTATTTRGTP
ncbi:MAG TPA: hypothetical protein VMV46_12720 [Thermoanaerobaculia bacterium]|nr:hypothetical protein [Thermoanaerobaculia bacterium]